MEKISNKIQIVKYLLVRALKVINNTILKSFRSLPFKTIPVILLSYPRSGSSWIGKVISNANNIAYMREPIMQMALNYEKNNKPTKKKLDEYISSLSKKVFKGIPPKGFYDYSPIRNFLYRRHKSTLVIKEVLAWNEIIYPNFSIAIIIILRNPLALAESFNRLNFQTNGWYKFGYEYGINMKRNIQKAKEDKNLILKYEDIASNPEKYFRIIYNFLNIEIDSKFNETINNYCYSKKFNTADAFNEQRYSSDEINKWKTKLHPQIAIEVTNGYLNSGLNYYKEEILDYINGNKK
ncbi:MAG: sulfotransferase domain-containing protein [Bacteroidales bacterium]|nr:sulfotransferase domain-containing protein [Bacteroidales bacterium]